MTDALVSIGEMYLMENYQAASSGAGKIWGFDFTFEAQPQPWQRAIKLRKGRTISLNGEYQSKLGWAAKAEMSRQKIALTYDPLVMVLVFYLSPPRSWKGTKLARAHGNLIACTGRADIDNFIKNVLDGLNRVAYHDDKQISALNAAMMWTPAEPHTYVKLSAWKPL